MPILKYHEFGVRHHGRLLVAGLLTLVCVAGFAAEDIIYKAYQPRTRPRPALLQTLQGLVGEHGKVIDDTAASGRLMILASSNAHEQVAAALAEADVPPRDVRIEVTTRQADSQNESGFGVSGSGVITSTREGTSYRVNITPRVTDQSSTGSSLVRQTIVVQDGGEASLIVSQEVPHYEWITRFGPNWGSLTREMTTREVGAFLTVEPQVSPDGQTVTLTLTPELRELSGKDPARVRYVKAATRLTVLNGATVTVGGVGQSREFYDKFLVGRNRGGQSQSITITVSPRVVGPDGRDL